MDGNFNRFMYTRGQFASIDSKESVELESVLWDTGNGGPSFIGDACYNTHAEFFKPMVEDENASIFLADAKTELKIKKRVQNKNLVT